MRVILGVLLLLALTRYSSETYCVCKDGVDAKQLQTSLDYACGAGADCSPILQNGACYQPNTVKSHCDWAVNSYFQRAGQAPGSCNFSGTATTSVNPPTTAVTGCVYPSSPSNTGSPTGTGTGTGAAPGTTPTTVGTPTLFPGTPLGPSGLNNNDNPGTNAATNLCFSFTLTLCFTALVFL